MFASDVKHDKIAKIPLYTDDDLDFIKVDILDEMYKKSYSIFNELRSKCQLCDVALLVENRKLSAHKVILAATIPYFRGMFTLDLMEANMKEINIEDSDMNYETVDALLSFAYTGELRITTSNVQSIMLGANFFQMLEVVQHCGNFLLTRLHPSNALSIREFCKMMCVEEKITEMTDDYIQKHFMAVSKDEDFKRLSLEDAIELLRNDHLYVDSEEQVYVAAMEWLNCDVIRHEQAAKILPCVRLPLLSPTYLSSIVASNPIIKKDIPCRDLIDEAKDYHLLPDRRSLIKSFKCTPRLCQIVPGLIVAIGGLMHQSQSKSSVEIYDPTSKKWSPIDGMVTLRTRVGVAVNQRQVYAIGGFNGQDRLDLVEKFDYDTLKWTTLSPLTRKRSALAAAFVTNRLYVCGGYDGLHSLSSIEIYDINRNVWEAGPPMENMRSAAGVTVIDKHIYICGGHDGMQIFASVERLDTENQQWERIPSMIQQRCRFGAATFKGKIYVAGGYDGTSFLKSVEVYDPVEKKWSPVSPMNMRRSRVSLVSTNEGLFAVAGFDGENNLCSMEQYDDVTDSWTIATALTCHEGGVGVGVIPMPPHML
ncbi:BTB domain-containing protein [Caenorhabditis elegans]|uniref:BTB domain-containing protein n=1 Tax=Caenorhabditis elegans TaxID=6239 RepID=Q8WQC4_CAEEL|nr:BTB domain-containing protein [Caenorhabditis elegans]CAC42351.2 BTB domain-containing protein [Caenorhabditis elegans]|eukprot:NP_499784.2 KELch-repeat containing protein [Caenorhabditis elegans]